MTGKLVVISGPSGAGKTSVCRELKKIQGVEFSISATTRPMREGERDGVDYHFLSREDFEARVAGGEFLEWASYNDKCYGTLRAPMDRAIAAGRTFLLEIEVRHETPPGSIFSGSLRTCNNHSGHVPGTRDVKRSRRDELFSLGPSVHSSVAGSATRCNGETKRSDGRWRQGCRGVASLAQRCVKPSHQR